MAEYRFRPFQIADLDMIAQWLAMPHVVEWWGDPEEQFKLVSGDLDEPAMDQFIVLADDVPFAYLQCYPLDAWPNPAFGAQPKGTRGIDQYNGRPDLVDRGHGSAFIRRFVDELLRAGVSRVITDPDPKNARAIAAYTKAGLARQRIVDTSEGPALLMVRDP